MKQWKRKAAAIFAAAALCGALPAHTLPVQNLLSGVMLTAHADDVLSGYCGNPDVNDGKDVTWKLEDGTLTISGTGAMGDVNRPWFENRESIKSVVIKNGVTSIGKGAFGSCSSLTDVTIPDSVTSIGESAFFNCSSLTGVTIPDNVTSIGKAAFYSCSSLTDITIPGSVTSIETLAFAYCSSLTDVTISGSVTSIGNSAFLNCRSLKTVVFEGETPPELHGYVFFSTNDYLKIYVPASAVDAYKEAWSDDADIIMSSTIGTWNCGAEGDNCTATLNIDGTLTISGTGAMAGYYSNDPGWFDDRDSVKNVVIENGVTSIGEYAFYQCSNLISITIPGSVTSIENAAFSLCSSLTDITIPDSVTSIGESIFYRCTSLTGVTIPGSVTSIGESAFDGCSSLTDVTIPDSVTSIGDSAFFNCSSLTGVTIPGSVTSIGESAFDCCSSLTGVTIPGSVTSIGESAFEGCISLTDITIPGSVTSIGEAAFYNCSSLTDVTILDGVTSIGAEAFYNCDSLIAVTIPDSVTSIGECAFYDCSSLESVTLEGKTPPELGDIAFDRTHNDLKIYVPDASVDAYKNAWSEYADQIQSIIIGKWDCGAQGDNCTAVLTKDGTLTISGTGAMEDYPVEYPGWYDDRDSVKNVVIENGVTSIRKGAFEDCSRLTSVAIPGSVTSIGTRAFYECYNLTDITIPDGVTSIGDFTFCNCSSLTDVTIPDSVTSIGFLAFYTCSSLTGVTIPGSVTSIGIGAFSTCSSLTDITIPGSVTSIGDSAFYYCNSLTSVTIPGSVTSIGVAAFYGCSSLTSVTIPDSVTSIGEEAFYDCSSLESVTLEGETPPKLGKRAFDNTHNDLKIYVPDASAVDTYKTKWNKYADRIQSSTIGTWNCGAEGDNCTATLTYDGTLTISGTGAMEDYPIGHPGWNVDCNSIKNVVIENGVTSIGEYAFKICSNLISITIPGSVTSIGTWAFAACSSLTAVTIPDSVTSIGDAAFYKCRSLTDVTIPDSVTSIGDSAFYYCNSLTDITIPGSVKSIGKNAFENCINLTSVTILYGVESIGVSAFEDCGSLTAITIPASVKSIGEWAFYDCSSLTGVTIPGSVTSIGTGAFSTCSSLTDITIPGSVTSIGQYAFYDCSSLESVTIPDSVTSIGQYAFYDCSSLTAVTIPDSVTSIGISAFDGCSSLTAVTIPDGMTGIDVDAFAGCSSLTSVILTGETPPELGVSAFTDTPDALKIYVPEAAVDAYKESWSDYADKIVSSTIGTWNCGAEGDNCTAVLTKDGTLTISGTGEMADYQFDDPGWYSYKELITSVVIENGVTSIGAKVFAECSKMTTVTIPDSVTSIGKYAFSDCYNLTDVTIPDSVTSIGNSAFSNCSGLTDVIIPGSVTSIADYAFYDCSSLESVTLEGKTPPYLGNEAFDYTHNDLKIYVSDGTSAAYKSAWSTYADRIVEYLEEDPCYPLISNGTNKVHVGFTVNIPKGRDIVDYGLIYYNSGNVIHTEHLTLENVGISGIKKANYYTANITDKGYGVVCVGYVQIRNADQTVTTYYTGELGGSYEAMTNAAKYVTLTKQENKAITSGDKQKVYVGFDANVPNGYTVEDYGLIYYNSGNVIHTEHLTLENVGICGISKARYWGANITDNGYGVTAVGFVKIRDALGNETVIYSEELGGSFAAISEAAAEKAVTLTRQANKALVSGGKNKVYVGFNAKISEDYTVKDYGLIYYNSGTVITTPYLTLENVGICGISKAKYWGANITDIGYGVTAVGFVTVEDANGNVYTRYTEELGGSFKAISEAAAANAVTLTRQQNKAVVSGGKNKVYVGFNANVADGYTVEDYGLIYYNSGNVIHTEHLTLDNVGICGISKAKYWGANITDNGYGVVCVGFVTVKDANGCVTTLYTEELGAKYADLVG